MAAPTLRHGFPSPTLGIRIEGQLVGWSTGFRCQETFSQYAIEILGDAYVQEHELTGVRNGGSFDKIKLNLEALSAYQAASGALWYHQSLTTPGLLRFSPKTITLTARISDTQEVGIIDILGYKPESRVWAGAQGSVMTENCGFVCRKILENRNPIIFELAA